MTVSLHYYRKKNVRTLIPTIDKKKKSPEKNGGSSYDHTLPRATCGCRVRELAQAERARRSARLRAIDTTRGRMPCDTRDATLMGRISEPSFS